VYCELPKVGNAPLHVISHCSLLFICRWAHPSPKTKTAPQAKRAAVDDTAVDDVDADANADAAAAHDPVLLMFAIAVESVKASSAIR
jgi:hypothetical protein